MISADQMNDGLYLNIPTEVNALTNKPVYGTIKRERERERERGREREREGEWEGESFFLHDICVKI